MRVCVRACVRACVGAFTVDAKKTSLIHNLEVQYSVYIMTNVERGSVQTVLV